MDITKIFPAHACSLTLSHNAHKDCHDTVEQYLSFSDMYDGAVSPADRAECIRLNEIWELRWYPDTPVGFCLVVAPTWERLMELANAPD